MSVRANVMEIEPTKTRKKLVCILVEERFDV